MDILVSLPSKLPQSCPFHSTVQVRKFLSYLHARPLSFSYAVFADVFRCYSCTWNAVLEKGNARQEPCRSAEDIRVIDSDSNKFVSDANCIRCMKSEIWAGGLYIKLDQKVRTVQLLSVIQLWFFWKVTRVMCDVTSGAVEVSHTHIFGRNDQFYDSL